MLVLIGVWVLCVRCFEFSCWLGGGLLFRVGCLLVLCFAVCCGMPLVAFGFVGFNGGLGWLGLILVFGFWALTLFTGWFSLRYGVVCLVLVYVLFEFAGVAISGFRFGVKRRWVWVCLLALSGGFALCLSGWF